MGLAMAAGASGVPTDIPTNDERLLAAPRLVEWMLKHDEVTYACHTHTPTALVRAIDLCPVHTASLEVIVAHLLLVRGRTAEAQAYLRERSHGRSGDVDLVGESQLVRASTSLRSILEERLWAE